MFSTTTASSISFFAKEDKLRTKFKRKCDQMRQGIALEEQWVVFIQGFQMLEKYKDRFPDTIAECAVDIAEIFKQSFEKCITPKDCSKYDETFYKITPHLAQLLSTESQVLYYRSELLNIWSEIVSKISINLRTLTFLEQTESVIIVIIQCIFFTGNYLTQINGLELVLKYIKSVDRLVAIDVLNEIMPCKELRDILLDFRLNCFDEDSRTFLNIFNMKISDEVPVYSIVAFSGDIGTLVIRKPVVSEKFEQPLWIDFNSSNHSISFFCERKTFFPEQNSRFNNNKNWILVEISVDQITLKEELCLLHVKAADKIRLIPPSFEDNLRFNLEDIKEITLQFTTKNLILIKDAKIVEFMNSKKNLSEQGQSGAIGFNIFHQFKDQKKLQKPQEKNSTKKKSSKEFSNEYEKANKKPSENTNNIVNIGKNSIEEDNSKNDNDNFSNLKSSVVVPETITSLNSKQTSKLAVEKQKLLNVNEKKSKMNQNKHMSRRESFETKCVVKLSTNQIPKYLNEIDKSDKTRQLRKNSGKNENYNLRKDNKIVTENNSKCSRYALRSTSKPKKANEKVKEIIDAIEEIINDANKKNFALDEVINKNTSERKQELKQNNKNDTENECFPIEIEKNQTRIKNSNKTRKLQSIREDNSQLNNEFIEHVPKIISVSNKLEIPKNKQENQSKIDNRKRKINSNESVEHTAEIHKSPKSKIGHIQPRITNDLINNSSLRLVNMVRPLSKDKKNHQTNDDITSNSPLNVDTEQINQTVEEYAKNHGFVGILNTLKSTKNHTVYTPEELDTVFDNLKEIDSSIERTTKKFFKSAGPERNVYDLENILKDARPPPPEKQRQSTKTGTDIRRHYVPKYLGSNKNVNYSYRKNIENANMATHCNKSLQNKNNNLLQADASGKRVSQVYDLNVGENKPEDKENSDEINDTTLMKIKMINKTTRKLCDENLVEQPAIMEEDSSDDEIPLKSKCKLSNKKIKLDNASFRGRKKRITPSVTKPNQDAKKQNISHQDNTVNKEFTTDNDVNYKKTTTNTDLEVSKISKVQHNESKNELTQTLNTSENRNMFTKNINKDKSNDKTKSFSQKIRDLQEQIESHKKTRLDKNSMKSIRNDNKYDHTLESSIETESKKLIINTSVSTPNNLHSPINSNLNKIDNLLTEYEPDDNNVTTKPIEIEEIDNEITITPNQRCDKTWLYEKFLNDIDSKNNTNHSNNNNSEISIEPIRHAPSKISLDIPELNNNYLTYSKANSIEEAEYPNDSVSAAAIQEIENNNTNNKDDDDDDKTNPIVLELLNLSTLRKPEDQLNEIENIDKNSSCYTESIQQDSSWRSNTSTKLTSILPKTNNNVEIIETCTKTIRIDGNNRTEERKISLKRRFENNDRPTEEVRDPFYKFKNELYNITNDISGKYQNIAKYPNELNLQNDIKIFFQKYDLLTKEYIKAHNRMQQLCKKIKIEENICLNSMVKGIEMTEKLTQQLQNRKEYFENHTERNKAEFKETLSQFKDSVYKLRKKVWVNHMDNFVQGFVENMKKFYTFDEED